jgi:hypothetical protein
MVISIELLFPDSHGSSSGFEFEVLDPNPEQACFRQLFVEKGNFKLLQKFSFYA